MKSKKGIRSFFAILLSAAVVLSCSQISYASPEPAGLHELAVSERPAHGAFIASATAGLTKFVSDACDRVILAGLSEASSLSEGTPWQTLFDGARKILGGGTSVTLGKILDACAEIQNQISELDVTVRAASAHTNELIADLNVEITQNELSNQLKSLRSFESKYNDVIGTFEALSEALDTYCTHAQDPSISEDQLVNDKIALQAAYGNVEAFYNNVEHPSSETMTFNFPNDLRDYLGLISPYQSNLAVSADPSDKSAWGAKNASEKTFLDYSHDFYMTQVVGEHQMYELMSASIGEAIAPLITYMTAYNMYASYKAFKINSDGTGEYINNESLRQVDLYNTWNNYYTARDRSVRGVYQTISLYEDEMLTMMRYYDTEQTLTMEYYPSEEHKIFSGAYGEETVTLDATDLTGETRKFYVIKPYGTGSVYAVSKWSGQNIHIFDMTTELNHLWDTHNLSQDYYNLMNTADPDGGYQVISYGEDLKDLTKPSVWMTSGYYLDRYLIENAGFTDIYEITADQRQTASADAGALQAGVFAILNECRITNNFKTDTWDAHDVFLNVSMPLLEDYSANEIDIDTDVLSDDDKDKLNNYPAYIIMKNTEAIDRTVSLQMDGGNADFSWLDGGNCLVINSGTVPSGSPLLLTMYPDQGKTIDTIELYNRDGILLDTLFTSVETTSVADTGNPDDQATFDVTSTLYETDDGGYQFKLSMPYQDCTIRISTKEESPKPYSVSLLPSDYGELEFEAHLGIGVSDFYEGDTVVVYARPYKDYALSSITVSNADTNEPLDVSIAPYSTKLYAPTEKVFAFQMPAADVRVSAAYVTGADVHSVRFDENGFVYDTGKDTALCYLTFGNDYFYDSWDAEPVFVANESAEFYSVCDNEHFLRSIKAAGAVSGTEIEVATHEDGRFTLTVGNEDILVTPEYQLKSDMYQAVITQENPEQEHFVSFADSAVPNENYYSPGDTVLMNVTDERLFTCNFTVTDTQGNDITASVKLVSDPSNGTLALTMPEKDIRIIVPEIHNYVNGICREEGCGHFQTPVLNEEGIYQIENAGNLFWLSSLVRDDHSLATFDQWNNAPKAELICSIDLENRPWVSIGCMQLESGSWNKWTFDGTFDGNGFTIDNFYMNITGTPDTDILAGLFGEVENAVIQNFSIKGKAELYTAAGYDINDFGSFYFGPVAAYSTNTKFSHIYSYVDIDGSTIDAEESLVCAAGITSAATGGCQLESCVNFGNIIGNFQTFAGITTVLASGQHKASLKNCANIGSITQLSQEYNVGGVSADNYVIPVPSADAPLTIEDSYNYGKLSAQEGRNCIPIADNVYGVSVNNCYYLDTSSPEASNATGKTAEQFKSGEAGWLLNQGVTDGKQAWYQNIDNGKTPDDYPLPDNTRGTIYFIESENRYSNYPDGEPPEQKQFAIRTYDDLAEFARLVNEEYDEWKNAKAWLENNIIAPEDSVWEQGIGSISENKPFLGRFLGKGYCITGLNEKGGEAGGLFEWVGSDASVTNLYLYDCDYNDPAVLAGGIAAVNDGTIAFCVSGVNLTSGVYVKEDGTIVPLKPYNSLISGTAIAGGIAARNNGTIYACRAAAEIHFTDSQMLAGAIAGDNKGIISNCAANSTISVEGGQESYAGGLCGANRGTIIGGYSSALIQKTGSAVSGSLSGLSDNGHFTDAFYTTSENQTAYGEGTAAEEQNLTGLSRSEMMKDSFTDRLNAASGNYVTWVRHKALNIGLPRIENPNADFFFSRITRNGITLSATLHSKARPSFTILSKGSEAWDAMIESAGAGIPLAAYAFHLQDSSRTFIPSELWSQSGLVLTVPSASEDVDIVLLLADGSIETVRPVDTANGKVSFEADGAVAFMIVQKVPIAYATVADIADQPYTGSAITPNPTVTLNGRTLKNGTDYSLSYKNNKAVGTATITLNGKGTFIGKASVTFHIVKAAISKAKISRIANQSYTGSAITPKPTVKLNGNTLKNGTDYKLTYKNNKNVGTATVTVTGKGSCTGTASATFKIVKATPKLTAANKTVKYKSVKQKTVNVNVFTLSGAYGKVTYTKMSGSKYLSVTSAGKIQVKKGTPKGTYSIKVKIIAHASKNSMRKIFYKTVKITVK